MKTSRDDCVYQDQQDSLAFTRDFFLLPEGIIYLDGNSLGPLPKAVPEAIQSMMLKEWGQDLISSWNQHDWIGLPAKVGAKIAPLLGAGPGQVVATDSTSINVFKLLSAALQAQPGRTVILSTEENFPTDLYMAEGLSRLLEQHRCELRIVSADQIERNLDSTVAVLMLTHVDFRSGQLFDMRALTHAAHRVGALALWDLAHSAGAVPLELDTDQVDLAVGCGYKYLNGGPGAPAFVYVAQRHQDRLQQPLSGWMGHAAPFGFDTTYQPAPGIERFLCGTPSILAMRALDVALDVWSTVSMREVRTKSVALAELFIERVQQSATLSELRLASPAKSRVRGSQVSFAHPQGYSVMQALIQAGVIGDFREPDLLRFGFTPLYTRFVDVWDAVDVLDSIISERTYLQDRFQQRGRVT